MVQKLKATLTNLAYVLGGLYMIAVGAVAPGIYQILLGVLSGTHHWVLKKWSRLLDYIGMYGAGSSLALWMMGVPTVENIVITAILTGVLAAILQVSATAVVSIIAASLLTLAWLLGLNGAIGLMVVIAMLMLAFSFNQLGDMDEFKKYHGIYHGYIWHVWTALASATAVYIVNLL